MKISQEIRDTAARQNDVEATTALSAPPALVEGPHPELVEGSAETRAAGMAAMSERFREGGGEIYVPAE